METSWEWSKTESDGNGAEATGEPCRKEHILELERAGRPRAQVASRRHCSAQKQGGRRCGGGTVGKLSSGCLYFLAK